MFFIVWVAFFSPQVSKALFSDCLKNKDIAVSNLDETAITERLLHWDFAATVSIAATVYLSTALSEGKADNHSLYSNTGIHCSYKDSANSSYSHVRWL